MVDFSNSAEKMLYKTNSHSKKG